MKQDKLMTPGEVAELFRVDPKTVGRWALDGKISSIRTPGGHRRYPKTEVEALMESSFTKGALQLARERLAALQAQRDKK